MATLEGVLAKISRARASLQSLEADVTAFCRCQERLIISQPGPGRQSWIYRGHPQVPIDFSVRVGEIVYNLRSALEHLVWQLALANGKNPGKFNKFPIFRDQLKYSRAIERELKGVSPGALSRIETYQPFQRHGGPGSQLWMLNSISNIDKHKSVSHKPSFRGG